MSYLGNEPNQGLISYPLMFTLQALLIDTDKSIIKYCIYNTKYYTFYL